MLNRRTFEPAAEVFKRVAQTSFALACLSTAGTGWAQSSVTIYGIVDTYVGSVKDSRGTVSVLHHPPANSGPHAGLSAAPEQLGTRAGG